MSDSELNEIRILLKTCAKVATSNQQEIKELREHSDQEMRALREQIQRTDNQLARLADMFTESVGIIRTMQTNIENMQKDIRGLQTENKRILDHLFGENIN